MGAEFRYYPCPLVSVRDRPPLYTEIGHTIINILADFRKYSYSLPSVRGLVIHMEDRQTTINIPRNRYDQVSNNLFGAKQILILVLFLHGICGFNGQEPVLWLFNGALKGALGLLARSPDRGKDGLMVAGSPQ
ncbi:zinc finger FYVE domain-containing protein 9-like [Homalodisca vitripennis]|uniref:zinc finger FYVE domain-containing protein 9-like n=1 Tax=Homalodisca vitripennis TaxID=197043 RepID=UPI001EEA765C|nr:zinc finger FYVE domain-containing protein 9-like [Homalodisca vitripennis]